MRKSSHESLLNSWLLMKITKEVSVFKTKRARSAVFFGASAAVGIGSMWYVTEDLETAATFYVVASVVLGSALFAIARANEWISKGEE